MRYSPEQEDELLLLIQRWCRITGHPYYSGLAYAAIDNQEGFVQDEPDPRYSPDLMKAGDMIEEYLYFVENPPWKEDPIEPPKDPNG